MHLAALLIAVAVGWVLRSVTHRCHHATVPQSTVDQVTSIGTAAKKQSDTLKEAVKQNNPNP